MSEENTKVLGWGMIIAIMVGVALATGLLLGLLGELLRLPPGWTKGGIGATVGVVGAFLIMRRRAALDRQKNG